MDVLYNISMPSALLKIMDKCENANLTPRRIDASPDTLAPVLAKLGVFSFQSDVAAGMFHDCELFPCSNMPKGEVHIICEEWRSGGRRGREIVMQFHNFAEE